jgi:uncharacterized protein (TIGR00255 family)
MKSMTGYGKSSITIQEMDLDIEIKSVNSRFFDLKLYLPRELNFLEIQTRNRIRETIKRGYIDVRINLRDRRLPSIEMDENKLKTYWELFQKVKTILHTDQEISIDKVLDEPGVLDINTESLDNPDFISTYMQCLVTAIKQQETMALSEGNGMREVLIESLKKIKVATQRVSSAFEDYKSTLFEKYKIRILELLNEHLTEENEKRLLMETVIYIDKADIHEELSRLDDHIKRFQEILANGKDEETGKTLNFIVQEMHREGNTLGSKYSTPDSFQDVLIIKEEIEKIREMVQNVE